MTVDKNLTILIATYNRAKYSDLVAYNINHQTYKGIKEIIILDDGVEQLDIMDQCIYPIRYIKKNTRLSIGQKRNMLINECKTKYFAFMDDDDVYFPSYIEYSLKLLQSNPKFKIVGSTEMIFYFEKYKEYSGMSCSQINLPHEATFVGYTKFMKANKFTNTNTGEGNCLIHMTKFIGLSEIDKCMCCLVHSSNTINKEQWRCNDEKHKEYYKLQIQDKIRNHLEILYGQNV